MAGAHFSAISMVLRGRPLLEDPSEFIKRPTRSRSAPSSLNSHAYSLAAFSSGYEGVHISNSRAAAFFGGSPWQELANYFAPLRTEVLEVLNQLSRPVKISSTDADESARWKGWFGRARHRANVHQLDLLDLMGMGDVLALLRGIPEELTVSLRVGGERISPKMRCRGRKYNPFLRALFHHVQIRIASTYCSPTRLPISADFDVIHRAFKEPEISPLKVTQGTNTAARSVGDAPRMVSCASNTDPQVVPTSTAELTTELMGVRYRLVPVDKKVSFVGASTLISICHLLIYKFF